MKVGMVGCGKLGLMVALAIESRGHEVRGFDLATAPGHYLNKRAIPFKEERAEELLAKTKMTMVRLDELCAWADLIFMAPQTPHEPRFEGVTALPTERADFDYSYLSMCVRWVNSALTTSAGPKPCVIISTVLPGTIDREIRPQIINPNFKLVYEPLFIAMGTVVEDFLNPEFVLVGVDDPWASARLCEFYKTIHDAPVFETDVRTAEGIKVFYNTFITAKIVLANAYGELAHKLGMNIDDITRALSLATNRLLSAKYLSSGMGDGGGCHPRDNIALSWLARKTNLSFDIFGALMDARERHCEWLARLIDEHRRNRPIYILGRSFKPETNIETGSPALLLSYILKRRFVRHEIVEDLVPVEPALYFIGTRHARYAELQFPAGSTVIDPFRYLKVQPGVELISIGAGQLREERSVPEKLEELAVQK